MPKRTRVELAEVAAWPNLVTAFWRAARGKRHRPEVRRFEADLDGQLSYLQQGILGGTLELGDFHTFEIHDPKKRTIHAPAFRERVLHHALMALIGPRLDRSLVPESFACRVGKGTHAAIAHAHRQALQYPWSLAVDIRAYFASIDHSVLNRILARRLKGEGVLRLCRRIIASHGAGSGQGLPIGALTSQTFANLYLGSADRQLKTDARVLGQVRYMDDIVWWTKGRRDAKAVLEEVECHLREDLKLELKSPWRLQRSDRGVSFCGIRIFPDELRLSRRRRRRYRRARAQWESAFEAGVIDATTLQAGYSSALAITQGADAAAWRRRELARTPAPDV